jgi:hypothetical protein
MKPQLADFEAERMLQEAKYIWSDKHGGFLRARRKGQSAADYEGSNPDVISAEEVSDHGLTEPRLDALLGDRRMALEHRRMALEWLAERIKQGSGPS